VSNRSISPLEAAIQQLDVAAEMLNLEPGICEILKKPKKSVVVSVPMRRDNGEINVFTGIRVQHNDARGPYKGESGIIQMSDWKRLWLWLCL